jgi:hypothetical protein
MDVMTLWRMVMSCVIVSLLSGCVLPGYFTPGHWLRVDAQTLSFTGPIEPGIEREFLETVTPETTRLIISSGGGDVEVALVVADYIHNYGLDIEVNQLCGSSCANYWFTAARKKTVLQGAYVGFHGDITSSIPYWKTPTAETLESARRISAKEQDFYEKIGVNPKLYAFSAAFTTGNEVSFWLPSPAELTCMGVTNLTEMWFSFNPSDFTLANRWPNPNVLTSVQDKRVPKPEVCAP